MPKREHSAILLTLIKLPFSILIFVLTIFKWPLKQKLKYCSKFSYSSFKRTTNKGADPLFDLIPYVTVNSFSVISGQVFMG